jgi:hypothetical protein
MRALCLRAWIEAKAYFGASMVMPGSLMRE